ncbi:peptide-methionine (S)-S-oxide reductase MsrA [Altererythrobacter sp. H2]|uniref:peptide-methionine (S)-S-oxide reductase MsrA n=1 Tax=Altererythrobacter sp. H2 TaxID=3108391 RepID=UPI002B4C21CC|nr:peptide-methionine (S)-S-oxide reductase MsrA [Altererythrobacter sp. H2]WRK97393.1 peptide-methionine (S)-S-oxide reductase MsrA [Altererythrobacter sp. H2]
MRSAALIAALGLLLASCQPAAQASEKAVEAPAAKRIAKEKPGKKVAIFAGGCFWGVEGVFSHVKGVSSAVSGYHGGSARTANYDMVSAGTTEHAEAVRIVYDPAVVRYDELLRIFFSVTADPTLRNRQGPDVGAQYRAALVPIGAEQRAVAQAYLAQMEASGVWKKPVVTGIEPYRAFHKAEDYHQDFMLKNPRHGYIVRWDAPKVRALKVLYPDHFRASFQRN